MVYFRSRIRRVHFGVIADLTGNIRYAFFVIAMIWIAVPLWRMDAEKGRINAKNFVYRGELT